MTRTTLTAIWAMKMMQTSRTGRSGHYGAFPPSLWPPALVQELLLHGVYGGKAWSLVLTAVNTWY